MQVPCMLYFEGRKVYIDRLKRFFTKIMKTYCKTFGKIEFLLIHSFVFELINQNIRKKVPIIVIRIIGRIFSIQSTDCSGETNFVRINRMFEILDI